MHYYRQPLLPIYLGLLGMRGPDGTLLKRGFISSLVLIATLSNSGRTSDGHDTQYSYLFHWALGISLQLALESVCSAALCVCVRGPLAKVLSPTNPPLSI